MSYTTVIAVWPGEKTKPLKELRNAWGCAPVIWGDMAGLYLEGSYWSCTDELWPLARRQDIPIHLRTVLALTYDNMIVLRADYARAAGCIRQYLADFPEKASHWPALAELFESAPDCPAIGLWMTSVCGNPFLGDWDEEAGEYGQPDWSKFWNLFEYLDAAEGEGK
ncbi:TPA: hypothetical protein MDT29_000892 [Klebsiella pneumoniae]|uniref:hypothetical protein n=1 Tax=Klebsiella pneumoniae TaxID=573 RepID=UPI000666BFC9|nr:hypothetical protein [Klebsiella pneumoniae]HBV2717486.1 hypothetical protein [Klebsiella pneumoniae]HBV3020953.1 hypothetical protein [Klebsiella pneumoniae]HBV3057533.1 hypothetical protein [Klebsiella pneumoniae]